MKPVSFAALFLTTLNQGYDYKDFGASWANDYEMCARPDNSPINIKSNLAIHDSSVCSAALDWDLDWSVHSWSIKNVGSSLAITPLARIDHHPDLDVETTLSDSSQRTYTTRTTRPNSIARLPNHFLPQNSRNEEFCLHSMHFHWGWNDEVGSEHLLDDKAFPIEVHFVHYSCERENIGEALGPYGSGADIDAKKDANLDPYELAVVGIFFEATEHDNPAFEAILNQDVLDEVKLGGETITNDLFLQDMVPEGVWTDGFYAYEGSLTTPPCTSIVRWHVMNAKSYIGKTQLERFRQLMWTNTTEMTPNFRQTVRNDNPLYACFEEDMPTTSQANQESLESSSEDYTWVWAVTVFACVAIAAGAFVYYVHVKRSSSEAMEKQSQSQRRLTSIDNMEENDKATTQI